MTLHLRIGVSLIGEDANQVIRHGLRLFLACCKSFPELISYDDDFFDWITWLVLKAKEQIVREEAILMIESFGKHLADFQGGKYKPLIWCLIFHFLSQLKKVEIYENQASQYLKLLTRMISSYGSSWPSSIDQLSLKDLPKASSADKIPYHGSENIFLTLVSLLKSHPVKENSSSPDEFEDQVALGLLNLSSSFFSSNPQFKERASLDHSLLTEIFCRYLFEIPSAERFHFSFFPFSLFSPFN